MQPGYSLRNWPWTEEVAVGMSPTTFEGLGEIVPGGGRKEMQAASGVQRRPGREIKISFLKPFQSRHAVRSPL